MVTQFKPMVEGNAKLVPLYTMLFQKVIGLTVVERHEHSGPVYYVPEGRDACVAYGSCDFKFRNDNNFDIKMYFSNTPDSIDVSINKISS